MKQSERAFISDFKKLMEKHNVILKPSPQPEDVEVSVGDDHCLHHKDWNIDFKDLEYLVRIVK